MADNEAEPDATFFWRKNNSKSKPENEVTSCAPYEDNYNMGHSTRGKAIIFNHMKFRSMPKRHGTNKDRDDLKNTLEKLNFEVIVHNDLRSSEINTVLQSISKMDHSDEDCLIITIMTHGNAVELFASDEEFPTYLLWKYFTANRCPTLAGKPKLFFIQACRGEGFDYGIEVNYNTTQSDATSTSYTIPVTADILIMYSTVEGFYSWRDPQKGSYFIQALVEQLNNYGEEKDLLSLLTLVNRQVAVDFKYTPEGDKKTHFKQMCSIVSTLTRFIYFKNK